VTAHCNPLLEATIGKRLVGRSDSYCKCHFFVSAMFRYPSPRDILAKYLYSITCRGCSCKVLKASDFTFKVFIINKLFQNPCPDAEDLELNPV
jgi:hypothetical protein